LTTVTHSGEENPLKRQNKAKKKSNGLWIAIVAIVVLGGIAWFSLRSSEPSDPGATTSQVRVRPSTLPSGVFTGKARQAYEAAEAVPDVLEQIPCFCGCMKNPGHRNNLDCFTDQHGFG
jgi:hypothetical protein